MVVGYVAGMEDEQRASNQIIDVSELRSVVSDDVWHSKEERIEKKEALQSTKLLGSHFE